MRKTFYLNSMTMYFLLRELENDVEFIFKIELYL